MKKALKYISISHHKASTERREPYALNREIKTDLMVELKKAFTDIEGILWVSTCNRTEVYFEATETTAKQVATFFIAYLNPKTNITSELALFKLKNRTINSAQHLLSVANGLDSSVIGDDQIISQIKNAYLEAKQINNQGSIMERVFQAVFRSHKRILKETNFKSGSRSTAYKALKKIEDRFGKDPLEKKKLLIIGAGQIAEQVLKYQSKFKMAEVAIANRTEKKAEKLAERYGVTTYPWQKVVENNYAEYDAIITAVSNRKNLLTKLPSPWRKMIFIDLALPGNIDHAYLKTLQNVAMINIDELTKDVADVNEKRNEALDTVKQIITEEINTLYEWLDKSKMRDFLKTYKQSVKEILKKTVAQLPELNEEQLVNTLLNNLIKQPAKNLSSGGILEREYTALSQIFGK